jgi:hypothetical protein
VPDFLEAHNKAQEGFTQQDVAALCRAAQAAWDRAKPSARQVTFTWRRKRYTSTLTAFRMLIKSIQGEPVACQYHEW